ncbi:MAG: PASTA domain-containing protein [Coriobacteriia bacterium]|nr:PASTA domain-containing protein [Coriobacteriia bacterium]
MLGTVLGVAALIALTLAFGTYYVTGIGFEVPDVTGLEEGVARARLAQAGLKVSTVERRFDPSPEGTVLSQSPLSGTRLPRGGGVGLVVSAGTEEFSMPDVVGMGINVARAQLEQAGLVVKIEAVDSDQPVDTVLETIPAAGSAVRTSDIVRVRIATNRGVSEALLPFAFQGMTFVIDPVSVKGAQVDSPLEVARRLRSLLEASGASVVVTRSVAETDTPVATRAQRAAETTGSIVALVGLDIVAETPAGMGVLTPDAATLPSAQVTASEEFADVLIGMLGGQGMNAARAQAGSDPVMAATSAPAVRVRLGALASREDMAAFLDPAWSDTVARAIYRALGERYAPQP